MANLPWSGQPIDGPRPMEVGREMLTKGWSFVSNAGQVILIISLVIWGLGKFGPTGSMDAVEQTYALTGSPEELAERDAALMQASWLGHIGEWIEPAVRPLGYDGRMGIAIISSFAAREVFVGDDIYIVSCRRIGEFRGWPDPAIATSLDHRNSPCNGQAFAQLGICHVLDHILHVRHAMHEYDRHRIERNWTAGHGQ